MDTSWAKPMIRDTAAQLRRPPLRVGHHVVWRATNALRSGALHGGSAKSRSDVDGISRSVPLQQHVPLVSVLVGVYNHERFVEECLDSVVNGSYKHLELIISDDCSTDRSEVVIRRWRESHPEWPVTYVRHLENIGFTKSLNKAIPHCRGEYICLIAADDVMLTDGIGARVRYLAQHPDKLAVFADCEVIDENGTRLFQSGIEGLYAAVGLKKSRLLRETSLPSSLVFHWAVPGPVFMCRRETYWIVGPYDERLDVEDWDMYLRLAAIRRLGFIDEYVAKYRWFSGNASHNFGARNQRDQAMVARKHVRRLGLINGMRLSAIYLNYLALDRRSPFTRLFLLAFRNLLLFLSHRANQIREIAWRT
jgi:glycosyltransferase involved in cell wall biosynthesis